MCAMATRRAQLRTSLERDLKATALGHLRDHGAGELSLRAVARDVGLSPAGVYRYFASREELLTALISDGYDDLADHLAAALDAEGQTTPRARMAAAGRAYRAWALEHPHEFALLYGTPIPGYAAPEGGTTVAANRRVGQQLLTPLVEAFAAGTLRIPDPYTADLQMGPALGDDIAALAGRDVPALSRRGRHGRVGPPARHRHARGPRPPPLDLPDGRGAALRGRPRRAARRPVSAMTRSSCPSSRSWTCSRRPRRGSPR